MLRHLSSIFVGVMAPLLITVSMLAQVFQPQLTLSLEKQEGFLSITVNGWTGPLTAGVHRISWDWGDGIQGEGWFPQTHTYQQSGHYIINVTSRGLFGDAVSSISVNVGNVISTPVAPTPVQKIESRLRPKLVLSAPKTSGLTVEVNGYAENAEKLIWNWGDGSKEVSSWFPAAHTYTKSGIYKITVKAISGDKVVSKTVTARVVPCENKLVTRKGNYTGFFNFPKCFFEESIVRAQQILRVTDAQYLSLQSMHNGIKPYDFAKIEYDSSVYGATTPEGIKLGDSAFPGLNEGNPRWEVMSHEQGHNFFGGTSAFYGTLAFGYPFLQESLAVLSAFYTYHHILDIQNLFAITSSTVESLNYDFANGREHQESQYNLYVSQGALFDINDVLTSQALDFKMIVYGETYGWRNYTKFTKAFEDGIASQFTFQNDGVSATEQSTYVIAALGAAFNQDFRSEFTALNFPVDNTLYGEIQPKIASYILSTNSVSNFKSFLKLFGF